MSIPTPMLSPAEAARMLLQVDRYSIDRKTINRLTNDIQMACKARTLPSVVKRAGEKYRYQVSADEAIRWYVKRCESDLTNRTEVMGF